MVQSAGSEAVDVEDVSDTVRRVFLLALDGPVPTPGEWLVVHSGYAIDRVDAADAEAVATQLQRAQSATTQNGGEVPT